MDIINDSDHTLDGVRLIWSLLKHPNNIIKRNSCLALVPCIKYAKDSPEMVRAFVGGLELTVTLLESEDVDVLSAACATIAQIATDPENLGILTDHGVVKMLANLVDTVIRFYNYCFGFQDRRGPFKKCMDPLFSFCRKMRASEQILH